MAGHPVDTTVDAAVEVSDLCVHLGGTRVLDSVAMTLRRGHITGLLGPSGSGKTTLVRALAGVQRHTGTAMVLGLPAGDRRLRRQIGYVTQAGSVYADLTVEQNVRYFASLYGRPGSAVADTLAQVDLSDKAGSRVRDLSGGQRGRTSLACALVAEPDLLLLDEPTVGLDPVLRSSLWERFRALADSGTTLLISSHVMDEADRCDGIVLLREGRVMSTGAPADLYRRTGCSTMEEAFLTVIRSADRRRDDTT